MKKKMLFSKDTISIATDVILVDGEKEEILLVKRSPSSSAFPNYWALPGGHIELNETAVQCGVREVKEETGYDVYVYPESAGIYDRVDRDPRGRAITIAFRGEVYGGELKAGDDAIEAKWFPLEEAFSMTLAFDHNEIIDDMVMI